MKVTLLSMEKDPNSKIGRLKDIIHGSFEIDHMVAPDIITLNGQQGYRFAYNLREGTSTVAVYRACTSHNIVFVDPSKGTEIVD